MNPTDGKPAAQGAAPEHPVAGPPPRRIDLSRQELETILAHAKAALSEAEFTTLQGALETLAYLTTELEKKHVSLQRLRQMLFGATTETTAQVLQQILEHAGKELTPEADANAAAGTTEPGTAEKPKGHGRHGADAYRGAKTIHVPLATLKAGDACPCCVKGRVYASCGPGLIVRLTGQAPIGGTVYELEKLRCGLCGEVFSAPAPAGVGEEKYDPESAAMIALLKYGTGLPFHRLERLQEGLGIPLPAATQWEIVEETADVLAPALTEMIHHAAQGQILHNDDTTMKVLALGQVAAEPAAAAAEPTAGATAAQTAQGHTEAGGARETRKGVFTSGIVSKTGDHQIALFFTGHKHAGENLFELLQQRSSELGPPIQMCDALSRNVPAALRTLLANCMAHSRRRFVDVAGSFPNECLHVLEILKDVYHHDAIAKGRGMSPEERLRWHQTQSGPRMAELQAWMETQITQRKVEPNSGLGEAIAYMRKHWDQLTLFLRVPGAPLDNNVCERALKKAILHRKNALYYKTQKGARVGDLFMSLIHTCELNGANPFHYLTELQKHTCEMTAAPGQWMPWNYLHALASEHSRPAG
jgi:transposase